MGKFHVRRILAGIALALAGILGPVTAAAGPIAWKNAVSGNWNTAGNWDPAQVPTSADDVSITLDGTYTVTIDAAASVNSLTLGGSTGTQTLSLPNNSLTLAAASSIGTHGSVTMSAGTLQGDGTLTVNGLFAWSGGTMSGTGTTTIAAGATLTISGSVLLSRTIINNATTNWTAGQFAFNNGTFQNNASFNAPLSNNITNGGGTNAFNNNASSTFTRDTATGILVVGIPFTNAGTVNVNTGTLRI
ncbi:MAG TPA: hypothetical protein VKG01_06630, partial [Thermoanaerobaculia bacterium]|nr:hypothetical protein [Thermoanaerobaculia bacterium]